MKKLSLLLCAFAIIAHTVISIPAAHAVGIDLLGDIAAPIIGPTKEKLKGVMVYVWMQPYAGYGFGTSDQTRVQTTGAVTHAPDLKTDGFFFGGRGGLLLFNTFRLGVDFTSQSLKRDTLIENTAGAFVQQPVSGKSTMLGATLGTDIPYTPLRGFVTRYFKASVAGDSAADGDGWGGGIGFVLKSPFLVTIEKRKLTYSAVEVTGKKADSTIDQYYISLGFMLF